jgi:hypothetical protein
LIIKLALRTTGNYFLINNESDRESQKESSGIIIAYVLGPEKGYIWYDGEMLE